MPYTILNELGRGGMGCVYKASDPQGRIVALKMMSNRVTCYREYRDLFSTEVATLRQMNNPSVVHIVGDPYQDNEGNYYLPMEYIAGETIEQHVTRCGPYSIDRALDLMAKVLDAMRYVHGRNVIHRDIKPSNIMIRQDGSICVIDFGIAKDAQIGATGRTIGRIIGTDGYMSPEQATGLNIDHRTDIYSLGCVFYYILTGQHAIQKGVNDLATVANICNNNMPRPSQTVSSISTAVDNVFLKSVDRNMMNRYQTVADFKQALEEIHSNPIPHITVGSSADNDIRINNQYVSRHHLVIRGLVEINTGSLTTYSIEITDKSRNGTGIDGYQLKNSSKIIKYEGTTSLPEVFLAGCPECSLDWNKVVSELRNQGWEPALPPPPTDRLGILLGIVSFIVPLIGWILWGVWKKEHPKKASIASSLAWAGFAINMFLSILTII